MRICDRCGPDRAVKASERIYAESEGMEIDLCRDCYDQVIQTALTIPKRINKKSASSEKKGSELEIH